MVGKIYDVTKSITSLYFIQNHLLDLDLKSNNIVEKEQLMLLELYDTYETLVT